MKRLFVGNLSFHTSESDLRARFESFGEIASVEVVVDRDTGRARGFAFVEMATEEDAAKAMSALNGQELDGREIKVSEAKPKVERSERDLHDRRGNDMAGARRR